MSLDEKIRELDGQIASQVKQWLREQHDQLGKKLREEIARQIEDAGNLLPESLITDEAKAQLEKAVLPAPSATGAITDLRKAVTQIDGARTQAAALTALLEEGSSFASRLAVF